MKRVDFLIRSLISRPNLRHTSRIDRFAADQEVCGELEITLADCDAMRCAVMDEVGRQAGDCKESF
jgi:hypothetical protein